MKTIFFALMWRVNSRTRGQGPYGYIRHKQGAIGAPKTPQKQVKTDLSRTKLIKKEGMEFIEKIPLEAGQLAKT